MNGLDYIFEIERLEARAETIHQQQRHLLKEIGYLLWPDWRGKDGRRLPNPMDRFISQISLEAETTCWNWTASETNNGYGLFSFSGKYHLVHRWIVKIIRGLVGPPLVIDHLCRNKRCVNFLHLEEVTQSVNVIRGVGPDLACRHGHKFTEDNTYVNPKGYRYCRICSRKSSSKYRGNK